MTEVEEDQFVCLACQARHFVLQLPEPAEVGVRFCKPGKRQYHCAKLDTEDSDTEDSDMSTSSRPAVNRQIITYCRAQ
jgi:hypothetical protein